MRKEREYWGGGDARGQGRWARVCFAKLVVVFWGGLERICECRWVHLYGWLVNEFVYLRRWGACFVVSGCCRDGNGQTPGQSRL